MDNAIADIGTMAGGSQHIVNSGSVTLDNIASVSAFMMELGKQVNKVSQFMLTMFAWIKNGIVPKVQGHENRIATCEQRISMQQG